MRAWISQARDELLASIALDLKLLFGHWYNAILAVGVPAIAYGLAWANGASDYAGPVLAYALASLLIVSIWLAPRRAEERRHNDTKRELEQAARRAKLAEEDIELVKSQWQIANDFTAKATTYIAIALQIAELNSRLKLLRDGIERSKRALLTLPALPDDLARMDVSDRILSDARSEVYLENVNVEVLQMLLGGPPVDLNYDVPPAVAEAMAIDGDDAMPAARRTAYRRQVARANRAEQKLEAVVARLAVRQTGLLSELQARLGAR